MIRARTALVLAAWCALWLAAGAPVAAQAVAVRSGAHDGFDRLVLDMPGRRSWHVVTRENGASVIFDGAALRFELGAVFDRIGRQRLRAISVPAGGGRLDLAFACACRIESFWHAGAMLVIDIFDALSDARASPTHPRPLPLSAPVARDGDAVRSPSAAGAALAARLDERVGPRLSALPEIGAAAPGDGLDAVRATLGRQLGRAASQGLVTAEPGQRPRLATPPAQSPAPPDSANPSAPAIGDGRTTQAGRPDVPGLRVTTSMDRDISRPARAGLSVDACPPAPHLDVVSWGGNHPFAFEVGRLNGALFGEFDTIREADALRLARLYIHHGFGAEARQVLGWLDSGAPEIALARELARLVEGASLPAGAALAGVLGCGEPGVLWAILAMPELPEENVFDHRALRRSFVALPEGLRRALGPTLVRRLVAAGHRDTADALLGHLRGGDAFSDAETGLARAALAGQMGDDAAAEQALREVAGTNVEQTGIALAETIERALARQAPVAFDDAQLAGALAFETRGTPLGGRLARAYLSALAASGAFDETMTEFERMRPTLEDAEAAQVASVLVTYLLRGADDVTFLRTMLTDGVVSPGGLDGGVALGVAQRLLSLGFPAQAVRHVAPAQATEPGEAGEAHQLLLARIALAQERPATALRELLGLDGNEADLLRADALVARGDHAGARRLYAAHEATRRADRAALHLGRAEVMADAENAPLRELGELLVRDAAAPVAGGDAALTSRRALLERSTALRGAMKRLLAATPGAVATR
ncbi:hypothetical protein [Roseovarius nitratireducens]|uniref:hypothetical protein n=1 Tax=Roseovarius nitratireducens TaxID=2044597 RepID=UPI000CE171A5|nr:hypothetical protein [Roseovarius nitratireducens]